MRRSAYLKKRRARTNNESERERTLIIHSRDIQRGGFAKEIRRISHVAVKMGYIVNLEMRWRNSRVVLIVLGGDLVVFKLC